MNEEILQKMKLDVDNLNKQSLNQDKTILLLLGVFRALSRQQDANALRRSIQNEIQAVPFDLRIPKGDQDRMKAKAIEMIPVYFP